MFYANIHERMRFIFLICIIVLIAIIIKVFYIQVFSYKKLNLLAESLWSRELPIKADRGLIVDRNGVELAGNITTVSLIVVPGQIKEPERVAKDLSDILMSDYNDMLAHVTKRTSIERIHPEGRRLSFEIAEKINNLGYDGVYLLKESQRYYPYQEKLSHVLGYVGIDNQGLSGLELYYNDYLTGSDGAIKYFSDGKGNKLELTEIYVPPTSGITLKLSIDIRLQEAIENELNKAIAKYSPEHALIMAMNPNTGEILAMASRPNFNNNSYKDYASEIINRNLPIWMTYEPGSTFKIITLSAALEEKTVNLFKDTFHDSGSISIDGSTIHCWKHGGHGTQTILQVVENSCNPGFVHIGNTLGAEKLMNYIHNYGFGSKTGIDLNGEATGILFDINKMGPVELATTSFGQGISVTPIQQIRAVSAVINGGNLYTPYIVDSMLESETKSIIKQIEPNIERKVISEETSKLVRYALESVVANGSGKNAYIENYRVGGKTGTAQKVLNGKYMDGNYILSFIGFMPADNPEIIVYVSVDNPKGVTQYGGVVSAPIARNVLTSAIDILNLKPTNEGMPREYTWLDTKYIKIPNVIGLDKKEASKILKEFKIEYSGNGSNVIYMSPSADTYVAIDSKIKLLLG